MKLEEGLKMPYRAKINGREIQYKNRFAYEVIKDYVEINKLENSAFFKSHFNGKGFSGYPVLIDETEKQNFIDRYDEREFSNRYFDEPVLNQENQKMYITTQWGSDPQGRGRFFDAFILYAKNELNLNIEEEIDDEVNQINEEYERVSKMNIKNIILYGSPGVGKTHNYKKLISLIEQGKSQSEIFDSIQKNEKFIDEDESFQNTKNEKRVEFVTFHQSFSYEDFIEGFRPQENRSLEIEKGIFREISKRAKEDSFHSKFKTISFDEAFEILREKFIEDGFEDITTVKNTEIIVHKFEERYIKVQSANAKDEHYVKRSDLEIVVNGFLENKIDKPADIKNLDVKADTKSLSSFYYPIAKVFTKVIKENTKESRITKNYYLVIDEINRGNISKIFGELITLIEESKRDTYEVTLPYSKQKFSVPSNLFIIGTMNTTDKSIALIDVALRRRFTFIKMQANSDLVLASFKSKFETLNKLIIKHIGEDYQIGHSYFMNIDESDLDFVLKYKIKPLLEEYYYGDDRISEVLKIIGLDTE